MKMSDMFDDPDMEKKLKAFKPHDPTKDANWLVVLELAKEMDKRPDARGALVVTANELYGLPNDDVKRELSPILLIDIVERALRGTDSL